MKGTFHQVWTLRVRKLEHKLQHILPCHISVIICTNKTLNRYYGFNYKQECKYMHT